MSRVGRRSWLALLLGAALVLRIAAGAWWEMRLPPGQKFGFGDSNTYWELGRTIARAEPYQYEGYRIFRTPGYPLLLSGLFLSAEEPSVLSGRILSAALLSFAAAGVYLWGKLLLDARVGLLAAALATFYPGLIAAGAFVLSEAPFCALLPLQLIFWQRGYQAERPKQKAGWYLATGALAGALTYVRPSWLLFAPFSLLLGLCFSRERREHLRAACYVLPALVVVMLPWCVRNYMVVGHFVPTTLQVGATLYDGLNPRADGGSNMQFVEPMMEKLREKPVPPDAPPLEYRAARMFRRAALQWASDHPGRAVELALIKFWRMWNIRPNSEQFGHPLMRIAVMATYLPVMLTALLGTWRFRQRGWPVALCWLPALYLTPLHMIFVSSIRYRQPLLLPVLVLSAGWVTDQYSQWQRGKQDQHPAEK